MINDGIESIATITEISAEKMVMVFEIDENQILDEASDFSVSVTGTLTVTLER